MNSGENRIIFENLIKEIHEDMDNKKKSSTAFGKAINFVRKNPEYSNDFNETSLIYRRYLIQNDISKITILLNNKLEDQSADAITLINELLGKKGRFKGLKHLLSQVYDLLNEAEKRTQIESKNTYRADYKKFRYLSLGDSQVDIGQIVEFKKREVQVTKIGASFILNDSNKFVPEFLRKKWTGRQVRWIYFDEIDGQLTPDEKKYFEQKRKEYYDKNTSNPKNKKENELEVAPSSFVKNHIWASKSFIHYIDLIKEKGIKPRHKLEMIEQIKAGEVVCDNRKMPDGSSWIVVNEKYIWYITHHLSSLAFDNNIKIYNQLAQCWRMNRLDAPDEMIDELREINQILFDIV